MSTYRLDKLFLPRSLAVVGASPHERSVGRSVVRNLIDGGFAGPLHLVNPHYAEIAGIRCVKTMDDVPGVPDVAIIATPPATVPEIVAAAGRKGVAVAIIITAGLGRGPGSLAELTERNARAFGLRLVGPNCLGVMAPAATFNATFAARAPRSGDLALISQSGAIAASVIEWAAHREIGLSAMVSIGDQLDVDFGDLLDYFALDRATRAILLYVESVTNARKFMSAARAAARAKPVVVVKAGRHRQGARAAATHTGALAGADAVYAAAFRRAGLLRVFDLGELFDAAEMLGRKAAVRGRRLAILTNGGGIGVLAVDSLIDLGGTLAELSPELVARLDAALPPTWSRSNPVDIVGDADGARYAAALSALLDDTENDAVVVMHVPTALASPSEAARAVVAVAQEHQARLAHPKPILTVWMGEDAAASRALERARLPCFATETDAVRGFMYLVRYHEACAALMETPPSHSEHFTPQIAAAQRIVRRAVAEGRAWLDPIEIGALLQCYEIPIAPAVLARDPEEAARAAAPLLRASGAVAIKILSRDIIHKSDVGGVRLNLASEQEVRTATVDMLARVRAARPQARLAGVTVHPMIVRPKARELIAGIADDPTFGPVIVFGCGGTAVEVIDDKTLALPPLDLRMAKDMIARTRVSRLLKAYRDVPAADEFTISLLLVKVAQLAADLPEIRELDLNPVLADQDGVIALDARVTVAEVEARKGPGHPRFAVRPYPAEWERQLALADGSAIFVRPVRPEDEEMFQKFLARVTAEDLRLRFFAPVKEFNHTFIARLTQLDYARAMAFVAIDPPTKEMLGVVRLHVDPNYEAGEFAILLRSDLKGRGLGWKLMELMIEYARSEGLKRIEGQVLKENIVMLQMCQALGFQIRDDSGDADIRFVAYSLA